MTIGEVEEFLWTLSTCLEGQIGDWRVRFGGALVSVRVDHCAGQITISVPEARVVVHAPLSPLTINDLQSVFQRVVDRAQKDIQRS